MPKFVKSQGEVGEVVMAEWTQKILDKQMGESVETEFTEKWKDP